MDSGGPGTRRFGMEHGKGGGMLCGMIEMMMMNNNNYSGPLLGLATLWDDDGDDDKRDAMVTARAKIEFHCLHSLGPRARALAL